MVGLITAGQWIERPQSSSLCERCVFVQWKHPKHTPSALEMILVLVLLVEVFDAEILKILVLGVLVLEVVVLDVEMLEALVL